MTPKFLESYTSAGGSFVVEVDPHSTIPPQQGGGHHVPPPSTTGHISGLACLQSASPKPVSTAPSSTYTARSSCSSAGSIYESLAHSAPSLPPKVGSRFSKESARILRQWLDTHKSHPFPSRDDNEMLQRFTGLSNVQIKTWFANARRRRKLQEHPISPSPHSGTDMLERPGTPLPVFLRTSKDVHDMDPLERWFDSPPEDEPASARDIARAVASGSQSFLRKERLNHLGDPGSDGVSMPSALDYSSAGDQSSSIHGSGSSHESIRSRKKAKRGSTKSRRRQPGRVGRRTDLLLPEGRFQCTFCTETFRTRYDWTRHEKSLHVPLERWLCSPHGPMEPDTRGEPCCAFCGRPAPDHEHLATHNPDACKQRAFHRKDHLKQHLRLVHNVDGVRWVLEAWKAPSLVVRSRCGFCGISLASWADREDHLADHFKLGHTMANWTGDWGFEKHVMDLLENHMPPYAIDYDRKTPYPFMPGAGAPTSPRSAYELISLELAFFLHKHFDKSKDIPSNRDLRLQACRIIFASEALVPTQKDDASICETTTDSWFRDLITFDSELAIEARFGPLLSQAESRLATLRINGKTTLFEACPLEKQLRDFVQSSWETRSVVPLDSDIQREVCNIIASAEERLETKTPDFVVNWFTKLVTTSSEWLNSFKERTYLLPPLTQTMPSLDSSLPLPSPEGDWGAISRHVDPSLIVQPRLPPNAVAESFGNPSFGMPFESNEQLPELQPPRLNFGSYVLNDANYHRWLDVELKRWATATMSVDSPERHIPSDEEIRHQARVLLYDDGDPWHTTVADMPEWLENFKRDIGNFPVTGTNVEETSIDADVLSNAK